MRSILKAGRCERQPPHPCHCLYFHSYGTHVAAAVLAPLRTRARAPHAVLCVFVRSVGASSTPGPPGPGRSGRSRCCPGRCCTRLRDAGQCGAAQVSAVEQPAGNAVQWEGIRCRRECQPQCCARPRTADTHALRARPAPTATICPKTDAPVFPWPALELPVLPCSAQKGGGRRKQANPAGNAWGVGGAKWALL